MPLHPIPAYYGRCNEIWGGDNCACGIKKMFFMQEKWTTTASNNAHHFEGYVVWLLRIKRKQHTLQNIHGIPRWNVTGCVRHGPILTKIWLSHFLSMRERAKNLKNWMDAWPRNINYREIRSKTVTFGVWMVFHHTVASEHSFITLFETLIVYHTFFFFSFFFLFLCLTFFGLRFMCVAIFFLSISLCH